ncbi:MAG: TRAP transporter substrate-binding protein DctP [Desulfatiglandaceae bacterium]
MRNKLRILMAFTVCMAFTLALTSQASAKKPEFKLKCAQAMMPKNSLTHQMMLEMCENITKRTDGAVTWKFFGPEVGDWLELERMVMKGVIDVQFNAWDTSLDPRWNVIYLPFLASTWDEVRKVYASGGPYDELGKSWAQDAGLYYLGTWLNTMGSLGLNGPPVTSIEGAAGKKIRCPPLNMFKCYVEKMGFTTVTIPWAEAPTSVSTGVVDGWVGSGAVYMYDLFRDVAKTMVVTYDFGEMWSITMNHKKWQKLPPEYQKIFQEESDKIIAAHLDKVEEEELTYQQKLKDHGWTVVDMAVEHPEELKRWRDEARKCWDVFEPVVGKIWMDKIKEIMGMPVD